MLRHEFQPGKLVAGVFLLGTGIAYTGDAGDAWETPPLVLIPVVVFGLVLGAVATAVGYNVRRRRSARAASIENTEVPASTSGSQAMR